MNKKLQDNNSIVVLVSGGFDSSILLAELALQYKRVFPIYIKSGFIWEKAELFWLKKFIAALNLSSIQPLTIFSYPVADILDNHWGVTGKNIPDRNSSDDTVYLPARNIILLTVAAIFCANKNINKIAIGTLLDNPFPDATDNFFRAIEKVLTISLNANIEILAPFKSLTKKEVLNRGKLLPLELTFSCLAPQGNNHCGKCNKCAERDRVMK